MANHKTGAQRRNDRMDKIFEESKKLNEKYHGTDSFGSKKKEIARKMKVKSGESMGFEQKWKVWQRQSEGKPSEKVVNIKGYDKANRRRENNKPINPADIPF